MDIIFFDDVTRKKFPGVVKALKEIEEQGFYNIEYLLVQVKEIRTARRK